MLHSPIAYAAQRIPRCRIKVADIAYEADKVWARVVVTGTQRGEFVGIPSTGGAIDIEVFDICRIVGSQVTEHWGLSDQLGMMRQLGVLPAP